MQIDPSANSNADNYKLMTNLIVPRPIAWITSQSPNGVINLAPFSFFNAVSGAPPYVIVSVGLNEAGKSKDTARNIRSSGEFVVNMVTEDMFDAMNISAAGFPSEESELSAAHLRAAPSVRIKVPRVEQAQVSLECNLYSEQPLGKNTLFIGEVVMFHVADNLVGPPLHIDKFTPIGRLGSPSVYCRTTDRFDIARMTYTQWQKTKGIRLD
ncbi:MAG: flavin reductase family protein [Gammaproteobacteria bacterium]